VLACRRSGVHGLPLEGQAAGNQELSLEHVQRAEDSRDPLTCRRHNTGHGRGVPLPRVRAEALDRSDQGEPVPDDPALVGVELVAVMSQMAPAPGRFEGVPPAGGSGAGDFNGPLPQRPGHRHVLVVDSRQVPPLVNPASQATAQQLGDVASRVAVRRVGLQRVRVSGVRLHPAPRVIQQVAEVAQRHPARLRRREPVGPDPAVEHPRLAQPVQVRQPVRGAGPADDAGLTAAGLLGREHLRQPVRPVVPGLRNEGGGRFTVAEEARGPRHARPQVLDAARVRGQVDHHRRQRERQRPALGGSHAGRGHLGLKLPQVTDRRPADPSRLTARRWYASKAPTQPR
jgi:hypothetical protein